MAKMEMAKMTREAVRNQAIEAYKAGVLSQKIVISTDADLTPKGKRRAQIVQPQSVYGGRRRPRHLAWYVGQSCYARMAITVENVALTNKWLAR